MRLLRSCDLSRAPKPFVCLSCRAHQNSQPARHPAARHASFLSQQQRPNKWGCKLITTCQVAASSPRTAAVESAESKSSKQQGQLVTLPTTDESPQLDRIRHSVSTDPRQFQATAFCITRGAAWQLCSLTRLAGCRLADRESNIAPLRWYAQVYCSACCSAHMSWPWQYRSSFLERKSLLGLLLSEASTMTLTCLSPSRRRT